MKLFRTIARLFVLAFMIVGVGGMASQATASPARPAAITRASAAPSAMSQSCLNNSQPDEPVWGPSPNIWTGGWVNCNSWFSGRQMQVCLIDNYGGKQACRLQEGGQTFDLYWGVNSCATSVSRYDYTWMWFMDWDGSTFVKRSSPVLFYRRLC